MGHGELIAIEYHSDLKEVQLDARLATLLSTAEQTAPFDRLDWLRDLASSCEMEPILAAARNDDSLVVLPLRNANGHLADLANYYTFRFRPIITLSEDPSSLMDALARDLSSKTHRITLTGVPDEDGSATLLQTSFRNAGWVVVRERSDWNHVLSVRGRAWDDYFAERPGKLRTTIKRKEKKLECRIFDSFDEEIWNAYEDIYRESWKPEEGSMSFLRSFAEREGAARRLRIGMAYAEGVPVAAQVWTVEAGTAFIHKLAYRTDAKALSPGSVLSSALFRHVIETDKVDMVDYGTGDDAYKRDWTEEVRPRFRLEMFRPKSPRNWPALVKTGLRRLVGRGNGV